MRDNTDDGSGFPAGDRWLTLRRPHPGGPGARAWDAADEQLVAEARRLVSAGQRVAVVDDSFGALALGLAGLDPLVIADSAALADALGRNADANRVAAPTVHSWYQPRKEGAGLDIRAGAGPFDAVILKVPRQLDYLEFLLRWSNQVLAPGGRLLTGGMIKHLPDQAARLYQRLVHTKSVLPARKKARLVVCGAGTLTLADWPALWKGYQPPGFVAPVMALPAVFAREQLDIGTRELLPFIPASVAPLADGDRVLDLACGNGILGLAALSARADLGVTWADISSQAVASARANLQSLGRDNGRGEFVHCDGVPSNGRRWQRILLNPPFHEGGAVGDHIARRLFAEAADALAPDGELLMVGNRHLGYHRSLRTVFTVVEQLQATPKFVVFRASRPRQRAGRS